MAHKKNNTNLTELLLQCITQPDPMLSMLEWLCTRLMETEVDQQLGAEKSQRSDGRSGYRSGYRPGRLDTRMGTMYLMVPKVRQGGYIPFFVTERKRSEAALIQVVQESFLRTSLNTVVRYPDQIRCYVNPPAPLPLYSPRSFPRSRDKRWFQRYCYPTASTKLLLRLQKAAELQTILIVIF
mgnify:CR=1 FL=1